MADDRGRRLFFTVLRWLIIAVIMTIVTTMIAATTTCMMLMIVVLMSMTITIVATVAVVVVTLHSLIHGCICMIDCIITDCCCMKILYEGSVEFRFL